MKKLILAFALFSALLITSCQKTEQKIENKITGKDWALQYDDAYEIMRFYPDNTGVKFTLKLTDENDKDNIITYKTRYYEVNDAQFQWYTQGEDKNQIVISFQLIGNVNLSTTYDVYQLSSTTLILHKADAPESYIYHKNNNILKDTKYSYDEYKAK